MGRSPEYAEVLALARLGRTLRIAMENAAIRRSQLAKRLGVTDARVSQMMQVEGGPNLMVRTLARLANALDCELHIELRPRREGKWPKP